MTKYEIIDKVTRYVKRFGMIMDPETMNKARDEAEAYDFRKISEGHYAVQHADKMYIIIEREGQIGCSCDDMSYNRMDGSCCKHIIAFSRLMTPTTKPIEKEDAGFLVNACGWTGRELHPEEIQIPPDPDLDIGVGDPLPEPTPDPEPESEPDKVSVTCQYCKMGATRKDQKTADAWLKKHEATCTKNPANSSEKPNSSEPEPELMTATCQYCGKTVKRKLAADLKQTLEAHEAICPKRPKGGDTTQEEKKMSEDKPAWNQEAWDSATQGSFATFDDNGVAVLIFTANDFEVGKPDKWGRATYEFSVIQNSTAVIFSVGSIRMMNALKTVLPLEGKQIKIIRIGEGTGTQYRVDDITDTEVIE